jgi:hypothetical protein
MNIISMLILAIVIYFQDNLVGVLRSRSNSTITFQVIFYIILGLIYYILVNVFYTYKIIIKLIKIICETINIVNKGLGLIVDIAIKFIVISTLFAIVFRSENQVSLQLIINNQTIIEI